MTRCKLAVVIICLLVPAVRAVAQQPLKPVCAANGKLICVVPQVYGPNGMVLPNPNHQAHFVGSFQENFQPLTVSVGTELTLLSIASPASGVLFTFDKSLGVVTRSTESYGPILTERAETIGRHRVFLAGTYQYYGFSSVDGIDLHHLPIVASHVQFPIAGSIPGFESEYITTDNRIDLKAHQVTLYATYGLTDRVDVSIGVPILDVHLGVTSEAVIRRTVPQPVPPGGPFFGTTVQGFYHFFDINDPAGSTSKTFHNASSATGIGDIVLRVKGTIVKGERGRLALGLDIRTPSGDARNFLGSGAVGVKPFIAASYRARVSPHVNFGYEYNGQSELAGNVSTGSSGKLPNEFFYSGGFDVGVTKRWTVAADLIGQRLSSIARLRRSTFTDVQGATSPNIAVFSDSVNMDSISVGTKFNPFGNLLVTGNLMFKVNDAGLRAKVIPLIGLSYTF